MISILIPTMNNMGILKFTCESIYKNTKVPVEIMVWDNGSDQPTKDYCEQMAKDNPDRFTYYPPELSAWADKDQSQPNNRGVSFPFNTMAKDAKYDYLFLSDNDIYFMPGWDVIVEELVEPGNWRIPMMIEADRPTRAIVGNYGKNPATFDEARLLRDYPEGKVWPHRKRGSFLPCILRRDDYEKIGGYDEQFFVGEADFLWRAYSYYKSLGKEMLTHPKSFIYHFRGLTPRPSYMDEEIQKMAAYMKEKYGYGWYEFDEVIGHYEIIKE